MGIFDIIADIRDKAISEARKEEKGGYMPNSIKEKAYEAFKKMSPEEQDAVNEHLTIKFPKD